jgi:hypothetical protein
VINPFRSDAAKKLARDLDHARAGRVKLSERLTVAQSAVTERMAATRALARDGADDGVLDAAEAALRVAQDRVATLTAALGDTDAQVAALESELAQLADKKLRAETAAAIDAMAHEIEEAGSVFSAAAAQLTEASRQVADIVLDGHGLTAFAMNAGGEVPAAVEMIARLLRDRAHATIEGTASAALPKAEPAPLKALPAPLETKRVFLLRHVKWRDPASGEIRLGARFEDCDMLPQIAAHAMRCGAAIALDNPQRRTLKGTWGKRPTFEHAFDLDAATETSSEHASTDEPTGESGDVPAPAAASFERSTLRHSAFEPLDRGPPYTLKVPREVAS